MNRNRWPIQLAAFPYAQPLLIGWQIADHSRDTHWPEYEQALDCYLASQDESFSLGERYAELHKSKELFDRLYAKGDGHIGTSFALARINSELGDHQAALTAIERMLQLMPWLAEQLPENLQLNINRPFLAPIASFDNRVVQGDLGQWIQAAIIEAMDCLEKDA